MKFNFFSVAFIAAILLCVNTNAQVNWTNAGATFDWFGATNWTPNTAAAGWLSTDIAQFNNAGTATDANIDFSSQNTLTLGLINVSSSRNKNLTISNASPTTPGVINLVGKPGYILETNTLTSNIIIANQMPPAANSKLVFGNSNYRLQVPSSFNQVYAASDLDINIEISGFGKSLYFEGNFAATTPINITLTGQNSYTGATGCGGAANFSLVLNRPGGQTLSEDSRISVGSGTLKVLTNQTTKVLYLGYPAAKLLVGNGATLTITQTFISANPNPGPNITLVGSGKIVYAPGATLKYENVPNVTTSDKEFPVLNGPTNVEAAGGGVTVALHDNRTVPGSIIVDSKFLLGNFNLTGNAVTSNYGSYSEFNKVITNGTGKLFITNTTGPVVFPVAADASTSSYTPVTISNGQGVTYGVRVANGINPPLTNNNTAVNKTWFIQPLTTPSSGVNTAFSFSNTHGNPGFNYSNAVDVNQKTGLTWNVMQSNIAQVQPVPCVVNNMAANLEYAYAISNTSAPLAVGKINFNVESGASKNLLHWVIDDVSNVIKIELEKSDNGKIFISTATLLKTDKNYEDTKLYNRINFYRLKIIENDGKITYSNIVAAFDKTIDFAAVTILQNPVTSIANVGVTLSKKTTLSMYVTDITGKKFSGLQYAAQKGYNIVKLNTANLSSGTYILNVFTGTESLKPVIFIKQ